MQASITSGFQLSLQQKALLSEAGYAGFRAQVAVLLEGNLDPGTLKHALDQVVCRHEILRTIFVRQPGMKLPLQVVNASAEVGWRTVNLESLTAADQQRKAEELFQQEGTQPPDLGNVPVLKATLLCFSAERHILHLMLPAACADAATLNNLVQEVGAFYAGTPSSDTVAEEALQYADYSEWQNELLQKEDGESERAKEFWRELTASLPLPPSLPFERRVEYEGTFGSDSIAITIDPQTLTRARAMGCNPSEFLRASWLALLWRITGQQDIAVAEVSSGRTQQELRSAFGLFARPVPLRYKFDTGTSFLSSVVALRKDTAEASDWQDYFADEKDQVELPLGFAVEEPLATSCAGAVTFSVFKRISDVRAFRLQLTCHPTLESWVGEFRYQPCRLDRDAVERIARHFAAFIESASRNPNSPINELDIITESERQQVLVTFNQTGADYPPAACIQRLFEEQVERVPARVALRFGDQELSYESLNREANRLAHLLRNKGVTANVPVGLCLERSAEMIVGLLAILKAGGAYLPLLPDNPKARLAYQLQESGSTVLITEEKFLAALPQFQGCVICLDRDLQLIAAQSTVNPKQQNSPQDLAYVIYTSGSTGVPKGVAVRHANLANYTRFIRHKLQLRETEGLHFATVSTISADLGNTCIYASLLSGGTLHVISYEVAMAGALFAEYVAKYPIDVLKITPSHLRALMASSQGNSVLPRRYLILGGEALAWDLVQQLSGSSCCIINHYGPTEATIGCCTFSVAERDVSAWSPVTVPIGRPIANDQVYILDHHLKPVPIGVPGELCVGGAGLAAGYLNQPEQTGERFVRHPFSGDTQARLYRTGDLARFLPDGNVEFLGRIDQQVKIRGFRVEPAEVEAVLKQHPHIQQAVIVPQTDKSGDARLTAYVVSALPTVVTAEQLRSFLQERLPNYMIPSSFVALEAIPLTRNGKLDVHALPLPEQAGKSERDFVAPRTPIEEGLARIWSEVLGLERVGTSDNFFDLGGHSLLATQVIARIRTTFGVQLPLRSLFECATIAGLAREISHSVPDVSEPSVANLLHELEGLTDEEAERVLAAEMERAGGNGSV